MGRHQHVLGNIGWRTATEHGRRVAATTYFTPEHSETSSPHKAADGIRGGQETIAGREEVGRTSAESQASSA